MSKDQKWAVEMTEYQTVFEPFVNVYFYAETETVPLHSAQNRNRYPNRSVPFGSRSLQPETQNRPYFNAIFLSPSVATSIVYFHILMRVFSPERS